jgi:hypothetical protein
MERPRNQRQFTKAIKVRSLGRPRNGDQFIETIKLPRGRRRGPGSMPVRVEPPRGPAPKSGGAAAALEFDD